MTLWETFLALARPSVPGAYSVEVHATTFRVARSYEGHPALLIDFGGTGGAAAARRLATISYAPPQMVELASSDGDRQRSPLAILECRSADSQLGAYFFRVVSSVLIESAAATDERTFEAALDALITLFRALERPGTNTMVGLWAELAIIFWSADPVSAVSSWHSEGHDLHDFSAGSFRLEVKATRKNLREHAFLLDQLSSMHPGATLVASLMLEEVDDGASVHDLVRFIGQRLRGHAGSVARLEAIVAESLGRDWRDASDERFSIEKAVGSIQYHDVRSIPTVAQPVPSEVKDVRFVVDLSHAPHLQLAQARSMGRLFEVLLPTLEP